MMKITKLKNLVNSNESLLTCKIYNIKAHPLVTGICKSSKTN